MAKHYRWFKAAVPLLAVCLLGRDAGSASGSPGYLPALGPVPVRFQIPSPVMPLMLWPPLIQPEKPTVPGVAQRTSASAAEPPAIEPPVMADPSSETIAGPLATEGLVDLQTQLNYLLSVSTNAPGAKVLMPVFVPPAPPLPSPSSHATYESH